MNGLGTKTKDILMESVGDTVGGIFNAVGKYCIMGGNRLSNKRD